MMLKLAITICDCSHVVHAGGDPVRTTSIIEVPETFVPQAVRDYLNRERSAKKNEATYFYESISLSIVQEDF